MRLKIKLIYKYLSHDSFKIYKLHIKKINRERWTKRCLGKSICFNEFQLNILSLYITSIVLVRVQKAIPRIIEIKKLISNSLKQVWTCIWYSCNTPFKKERDHSIRTVCSYFHRSDSNERTAQSTLNNKKVKSFSRHGARELPSND